MSTPIYYTDNGLISYPKLTEYLKISRKTAERWFSDLPESAKGYGKVEIMGQTFGNQVRAVNTFGVLLIAGRLAHKSEKAQEIIERFCSNAEANQENIERYKENNPHKEEVEALREENQYLRNQLSLSNNNRHEQHHNQKRRLLMPST